MFTKRSMISQLNKAYDKILDEIERTMDIRGWGYRKATQYVLRKWAKIGMPILQDSIGRNWEPSRYIEMTLRTDLLQIHIDTTKETAKRLDVQLIVTSAHASCSKLCEPWQGRILSISLENTDYPSLDYAMAEGYHHPNCRHIDSPYVEGAPFAPSRWSKDEIEKARRERAEFVKRRNSYRRTLVNKTLNRLPF